MIVLVTVASDVVVAAVSFTIVTGLPLIVGVVPNVQPSGSFGRVGSVTVHSVPVLNGPMAALVAPAARLTVPSLAVPSLQS